MSESMVDAGTMDDTLIGLDRWDGSSPVILVCQADEIQPIQANYPRATVMALPEAPYWAILDDSWAFWLPVFRADITLWPTNAIEAGFFASLAAVLDVAGVRTLRVAERATDDISRYANITTIWRDRAALR